MGGRREVSIISQRPVTNSDFAWECLNIFATGCSDFKSNYFPHTENLTENF